MKYVDMNDVVYHASSVAFPGLGNCHGVVYHTNSGLFAYHAAGNPQDSAGKAEAFAGFVSNHSIGNSTVGACLYGFCPKNRHSADGTHKAELQIIARALKFTGPIKGYRWDMASLGWSTTYVEVTLNHGAIAVTIEDFTSQPYTSGVNADALGHKFVSQGKTPATIASGQWAWARCTTKSSVTIGVTRKHVTPTAVTPVAL